MKNINVRELFCFEEVASVIGEEKAEEELGIVVAGWKYDEDMNYFTKITLLETDLELAFDWDSTTQGFEYWCDIKCELEKGEREDRTEWDYGEVNTLKLLVMVLKMELDILM